jgi:hypothetical protein
MDAHGGQDSIVWGIPRDARKEAWCSDALKAYGGGPKQKEDSEGESSVCRHTTMQIQLRASLLQFMEE